MVVMKPDNTYIKIIFSILVLLTFSCTEILFSDEEQIKEFKPGAFSNVIVEGTFDLVLIQDSTERIIVRGKNSMKKVNAVSVNDTLLIRDNSLFNPEPGRNTVEVHFVSINYLVTKNPVLLTNKGVLKGDLISWDGIGEIAEGRLVIDCNVFIFTNSANTLGNIMLAGRTDILSVFNRYGSNVFADSLKCVSAEITNESIGDVIVNASQNVSAWIWGSGNILYRGNPVAILKEKKGSGQLIQINE